MTTHKHYAAAYRAHYNTSHSPEKRAADWCAYFDEVAAQVTAQGGDVVRFESLFLAFMAAKSRCASSMITGPANFPQRRQEKARRSEEKHGRAMFDYVESVERRHKRAEYEAANPQDKPLGAADVAGWQAKVDALTARHAHLKANPSARAHSMSLAYALKDIKNAQHGLKVAQSLQAQIPTGERFTVDTAANRVFFTFEGKPDDATRELLKSRAFKWTPSQGHWGRQLTDNAINAAKAINKQLEQKQCNV